MSRQDLSQVFRNTIVELVNSLVMDSLPTIGLVTAHKDPELPISKLLLHSLVDSHKSKDSITSTTPGLTRIWSQQAKSTMLLWKKALEGYHKASANELADWPDSNAMYPLPLDAYTRESTPEVRSEIKQYAMEALWNWRLLGTPLARIYPSERDWKEGLMISLLQKKDNLMDPIFHSSIFNIVKGIGEAGETIIKYFILPQRMDEVQESLKKLWKDINQPFFPLPKYSISTQLEKQGMSFQEACQAAAIFKIKLKACLLEIWSHINPRMSAQIFRRNQHSIWNLSKPFWRDETPCWLKAIEEHTEVSFFRDLLPHIMLRRKRVSFHLLESTMNKDYEDTRTHEDYSIDPSTQYTRHIHANITSKHVSSSPRSADRTPHIGCGRLHNSIMGPQYFHSTTIQSHWDTMRNEHTGN